MADVVPVPSWALPLGKWAEGALALESMLLPGLALEKSALLTLLLLSLLLLPIPLQVRVDGLLYFLPMSVLVPVSAADSAAGYGVAKGKHAAGRCMGAVWAAAPAKALGEVYP